MTNARASREMESRENELRNNYSMEYVSPLTLPPGLAKDGYSYHWACREIKGEPTYEVERLAAKGWTLVPVDRAPNYSTDPLNRRPLSSQYLCYQDVILMERPEVFSQRETDHFNQRNENALKSLRGVSNDLGSFSSPIRNINSF